jgi:BirA family transcriptional regulator, biotin operon repressor / biotin---[acetyl-CoA-carboxylase] ligase
VRQSTLLVLNCLADGCFHSGSEIGDAAGVSRAAVWKQLQKLIDIGLDVESVKGKGYRLPGGFEPLEMGSIQSGLSVECAALVSEIDLHAEIESTNVHAMKRIAAGNAKGYLCLSESQSSGKGRRGRHWVSPFGHNIYLSFVWEFDGGANQLEGLSLAVGVEVAKVLIACGLQGVALKWPNDILLNGRKLGGILLEMSGDSVGVCQVVIGIGLNVRMNKNVGIDQSWASVSEQLASVSRNKLVSGILNRLAPMLNIYGSLGFSGYQALWESLDAYRGKKVTILSGNTSVKGVACGVYANGSLRLLVDEKERPIYGGEVSLRLEDDT